MSKEFTRWIYVDRTEQENFDDPDLLDKNNIEECITEGLEGVLRTPGEEIFLNRPKLNYRFVAYKVRNGPYILTNSNEQQTLKLNPITQKIEKEISRTYVFHRCVYKEDFEGLPVEYSENGTIVKEYNRNFKIVKE